MFCNRIFFPQHDGIVHPIRIAQKRKSGTIHRSGANKYQIIKDDMVRAFKGQQRAQILFTSFIDLYALPDDFPGVADHTKNSDYPRPYVEALEKALAEDIPDTRFVPHLQLHEFETLLFADPLALKIAYPDIDAAVTELERMVIEAGDVEKINDSPHYAPSKRIIRLIPSYCSDKTTVGPDVTEHIGMEKLKNACHHFRDWVTLITHRLSEI